MKTCNFCECTDVTQYTVKTLTKNGIYHKEFWTIHICEHCGHMDKQVNAVICPDCDGIVSELDNVCTSCGIIFEGP